MPGLQGLCRQVIDQPPGQFLPGAEVGPDGVDPKGGELPVRQNFDQRIRLQIDLDLTGTEGHCDIFASPGQGHRMREHGIGNERAFGQIPKRADGAELQEAGACHQRALKASDAAVFQAAVGHLPEQKIAIVQDLVCNGVIFVSGVNRENWIATIEMLRDDPTCETLLVGHGPPTTHGEFHTVIEYLKIMDQAWAESETPAAFMETMRTIFPGYAGEFLLTLAEFYWDKYANLWPECPTASHLPNGAQSTRKDTGMFRSLAEKLRVRRRLLRTECDAGEV